MSVVGSFGFSGGLVLLTDFISSDEEEALLAAVYKEEWSHKLARRTQHYGYEYDYASHRLPRYIGALPEWSDTLVDRLVDNCVFAATARPNQMIVNEYTPGQGISAHTDSHVFASPIVSVSLGSPCIMKFSSTPHQPSQTVDVLLPRRSALIMDDEARWNMRHEIAARKSDNGVPRQTRVSLTFRIVPKQTAGKLGN